MTVDVEGSVLDAGGAGMVGVPPLGVTGVTTGGGLGRPVAAMEAGIWLPRVDRDAWGDRRVAGGLGVRRDVVAVMRRAAAG